MVRYNGLLNGNRLLGHLRFSSTTLLSPSLYRLGGLAGVGSGVAVFARLRDNSGDRERLLLRSGDRCLYVKMSPP